MTHKDILPNSNRGNFLDREKKKEPIMHEVDIKMNIKTDP